MNPGVALPIAVALTFFGADRAAGQDVAFEPGARVRVAALGVSAKPFVGRLVASDEATLTIVRTKGGPWWLGWPLRGTSEETLRLPRESVTRFDRNVRRSRKNLGATVGGLIGLAAGAVIVARETTGADGCDQCLMAAAIVATPFALLGAAIAPGDRWAAEDPGKVRVGFGVPARSVGLRLAVRF